MQPPYASFEPRLRSAAERFARGFGAAELVAGGLCGAERAVVGQGAAADTLFEIGSITKVFTGLTLADMTVRGELSLDTPARELLPAGVAFPAAVGREITLADLASHGSGLPGSPPGLIPEAMRHWSDPYLHFDVDALYHALARTKLKKAPGERFRYSNFGAGLLGHLLSLRAGSSWYELVSERVLEPLGMRDTHEIVPPGELHRFADGHKRSGRRAGHWTLPEGIAGAGALRSTADELLTFLRAHVDPGSTPLGPAIELARRPRQRMGRRAAVGLGWLMLAPRRGPRAIWHSGGTGGFRTVAGLAPDTGVAVVVLSNSTRAPDRLGLKLLRELSR